MSSDVPHEPASPFTYVDDPAAYRPADTLVVRIPAKAKGKEKLFGVLADKLRFPRYFGHNWDAFEECLGELSWLEGVERVAIVHEGLPFSFDGEHLPVYLSILHEVVTRRRAAAAPPQLEIVFASRHREAIETPSTRAVQVRKRT